MKLIYSLFIFTLFILAGCSNTSEEKQEQSTEKAQVNPDKVVLIDMDVNGMTCTGCENTIKAGVSELDGIVSVEASHVDAKAYVKADTSLVDINKIKEAITAKGYEVVGSEIKSTDDTLPQKEGTE